MRHFNPETESKAFRNALGRYATGVTVITTVHEGVSYGITANSFASVSLDPPLVLWSPDKRSSRYQAFMDAQDYAIHILASDQKSVCDSFARSANAFDEFPFELNDNGIPILKDCLAVLECKPFNCFDGGDHSILLGQVHNVRCRDDGDGLVFANGKFLSV